MPEKITVAQEVIIVVKRYEDAYSVAKNICRTGAFVKFCAMILPLFVALEVFTRIEYIEDISVRATMSYLGILATCITWLLFYSFGVIICAHGQSIMTSLDCAVNTSPFLSDDLKARVMSVSTDEKVDLTAE